MVHLYQSLLLTIKSGYKAKIVEDSFGNSASNIGLIYKSILLGNCFIEKIKLDSNINSAADLHGSRFGIMLPNSVPTAIVFFALQKLRIATAIINFTSGQKNILSSVKSLSYVITSKKFIEETNMQNISTAINKDCKIIYLEDIKDHIDIVQKYKALKNFFESLLFSSKSKYSSDQTAVILFTSGTESEPKAVGLTHKNLYTNREQVLKALKIRKNDKFFTCLPFFHSFGLSIGVLLPILSGCKVFLYPTPLHFEKIPNLIKNTKSTVFFSTDTFLKKYIPYLNESTFQNVRYLIAGAEKVDEGTHEKYKEFGVQILEGYGVTEASPAISVNTFKNYRLGSVGKFLPGIKYEIEKIDGCEEGGLLYIRGDNVIKHYLDQSVSESFEMYNTGDIVKIDTDGYLFILGRLKRFAKIAGEMISLSQVEVFPKKIWPENNSAICSIKDSKKGESLILLTDNKNADLKIVHELMKLEGLSNLYFPKEMKIIDEFPILGSGKIDFRKLQEFAES